MQKILAGFLVVVFALLISFNVAHAVSKGFGGTVVSIDQNVKAIMDAQSKGFKCIINGRVIEVKPKNSSINLELFIPSFLSIKNSRTLRVNQGILGGYYRQTPIPCIKTDPKFQIIFVPLNTVTGYGLEK